MTAERVDLDAVQEWASHDLHTASDCKAGDQMLLRLVTELRAAREVVEAAAKFWDAFGDECGGQVCDDLAHALNAYDQAVGRPATAAQPPWETR